MIAKTMKIVTALAIAVAVLASCSSGNDLGMASQEAVAKVKELVKSQVPADAKVYRVEWRGGPGGPNAGEGGGGGVVVFFTPPNQKR